MVTHNDAIKQMADRVVKLRDGMIRKNYLMKLSSQPQSLIGKEGQHEKPSYQTFAQRA